MLPCTEDMKIGEIIEYTIESLSINDKDIECYELHSMNGDDQAEVENDLNIGDLLSLLETETGTLKFQLEKKIV